jgi:hypothetical protein
MKSIIASTVALAVAALCSGPSPVEKASQKITGQYVEARTASVFTGACHYNGELVTTGREAIVAWKFTSGQWQGVGLSGVKAMGAVTSDGSLGNEQAARKTELVVDSSVSDAQSAAVVGLLSEKCRTQLGEIVAIRRAPIAFKFHENECSVNSDGYASMSVKPMPDGECCKQPNLVWYSPLTPVENRKVGFTQRAAYTAGTVGDTWQREGENSAFYGSFVW